MQAGFRSLTSRCSSFVIYVNWNSADCGAVKISCISSCVHRFCWIVVVVIRIIFFFALQFWWKAQKHIAPADMKHRWRGDFMMRSCTVTIEKEKKYIAMYRDLLNYTCVLSAGVVELISGSGGRAKRFTWGYDRGTGDIYGSISLNKLSKKHDSNTLLSQDITAICLRTLLILHMPLTQLRLTVAWTLQDLRLLFFSSLPAVLYAFRVGAAGDQTCFSSTSYECLISCGEFGGWSNTLSPWAMCAVYHRKETWRSEHGLQGWHQVSRWRPR